MVHETKIRLVRILLPALLLAMPAAGADWTYSYSDDFSSDKAQSESYAHSTFWTDDANPLPEPCLQYFGTGSARGLVFMAYKDQSAELGYYFPLGTTQTARIMTGTLQVDVSFPCNAELSQFPPGQLLYVVSPDGLAWSGQRSLQAGHHQIPLSSKAGTCYVKFSGDRAVIDNIRVSLSSPSATIHVPADFGTIQQAIDAAGTGDIIEVAAGTYTGAGNWDIDFQGKQIVVRSADGPARTIINCGDGHRGFYFHRAETADSVLCGFTIRGGRVRGSNIPAGLSSWTASASHPIGGGIYCEFSSPSIIDCVIEDCGAELGGGIGCVGGEPAIIDCTIKGCLAGGLGSATSGGRGAGIALVGQANATITDCVIQGNTGSSNSQGAGIYILHSTATISGCTISSNVAPGALRGGGAYCGGDATDATFKNCIFSANQADAGAGILAERSTTAAPSANGFGQGCRVEIVNCTIAQNRVAGFGAGGVDSSGANITIRNSIVWGNQGTALSIVSPASMSPVAYSDIQGGYSGQGNINSDPLFAGTYDYHLRSIGGRYDSQSAAWRKDTDQSPCIDAGDPSLSAADEPAPNGSRINMGAYGGTPQASKGSRAILHVDAARIRAQSYATIQAAINAARDGDAILVWPGVYQEEITFSRKTIILQSAADAAVITAPNGYACSFYGAESSRSILANFVIAGCGEGAVFCDGASPTLTNLTIVQNQFGISAYGGANPVITNCIIWENPGGSLFQCRARYSCIEQAYVDSAAGNINANPQFVDSDNGDFHVRSQYGRYVPQSRTWTLDGTTSPCIDAGDPAEYPRNERMPNGRRINMGAYGGTMYASMSSGPVCP